MGGDGTGRLTCLPPRFDNPGYGPDHGQYMGQNPTETLLWCLKLMLFSILWFMLVSEWLRCCTCVQRVTC